jgi:hypothetical protein
MYELKSFVRVSNHVISTYAKFLKNSTLLNRFLKGLFTITQNGWFALNIFPF